MNRSKPVLDEENALVMEMFQFVSPSRPVYMGGAGAVPLAEIEVFCRMAGFGRQEALEVAQDLRELDLLFLDLMDQQRKRARSLAQPKGDA